VFLFRLPQSNNTINRLSLLFVVEALALLSSFPSLSSLFGLEQIMAFSALHIVADMVMFVLHPTFVAYALPNTFLAFLRKPLALLTLIVIASLLLVWTNRVCGDYIHSNERGVHDRVCCV
jgi:hypothetical protein